MVSLGSLSHSTQTLTLALGANASTGGYGWPGLVIETTAVVFFAEALCGAALTTAHLACWNDS